MQDTNSVFLHAVEGELQPWDLAAIMLGDDLTPEQLRRLARSPALWLGEVRDEEPRMAPSVVEALRILGSRPRILTRQLVDDLQTAMRRHNLTPCRVSTNLKLVDRWLDQRIGKVVYTVHWGPEAAFERAAG